MKIRLTPWDVPMHRRLEVFGAWLTMVVVLFMIPFSITLIAYLLYAGNLFWRTICVSYLIFVYYDRKTGDTGGRGIGVNWFREWRLWPYYLNYFPLDLVKTADLPADRNYLLCLFPHGVICHSALGTFSTNHSKWNKLFPRIRGKFTTLSFHMYVPIMRELLMNWGYCAASPNSLNTLLSQSNDPNHESNRDGYTSNAPVLMVGGAMEALSAFPNQYKFVLKNRRGFVKIAFKNGISLVPAISFGENSIFEQVQYEAGSFGRKLQDTFKWYTGVSPVHFNGRGFLQYNFGFIPRRHPITMVIGAPIKLEKNINPSNEMVEEIHQLFCKQLIELFETHKKTYIENSENVHVEII